MYKYMYEDTKYSENNWKYVEIKFKYTLSSLRRLCFWFDSFVPLRTNKINI